MMRVTCIGGGASFSGTKFTAVDKDGRRSAARLEIARADAVDVEPAPLGETCHAYFAVTASRDAAPASIPKVRQSVVFGTMPSKEARSTCRTLPSVPIAAAPSLNFFTAASIIRRNCTTATSLEPGWSLLRSEIGPI